MHFVACRRRLALSTPPRLSSSLAKHESRRGSLSARRLSCFLFMEKSMNEQRTSLCDQPVVFQLPDEGTVVVRRNVEYRVADGSARMMDIYAPAGSVGPMAAVVLV